MTRRYQPTQYGSNFQGFAKEKGFNPVQPLDQSNQIKERAQDKIDNIKNLARANQIQANLDRATLQGNQQIAKAKFDANWKVINGLISLTKTGIEGYQTIKEDQLEKEKDNALWESIGGGEELLPPVEVETSKENNKKLDLEVNANGQANNDVSNELLDTGDIEKLDLSNQLQESSTSNIVAALKGDVFGAVGIHQAYLRERLSQVPPDEMPKNLADIRLLLKEFNKDFMKAGGFLDPRMKDLVIEHLAETIVNNTNFITAELVKKNVENTQKSNLLIVENYVAKVVDNDKLTLQQKWNAISDAYYNNNVGFTDRGLANEAALKQLLEEVALSGPSAVTDINNLRNVLQVDKQKGTELNKKYQNIFDEYETKARDNNIREFQRNQNERTLANKKVVDDYYKNPTPDNKTRAINSLLAIGTKESIAEALSLSSTGLEYDPKKAAEIALEIAGGAEYDEDDLKALLDEQVISKEEYENLLTLGPLAETKRELKDYVESIDNSFEEAITKGYDESDLKKGNLLSQLSIKKEGLKDEVYEKLLAEIRVNPNLINDKNQLAVKTNEIITNVMAGGRYTATQTPGKGWQFTYDSETSQKNLKTFNIVGKPGSQDFSSLTYDQLFNQKKISIAEMSATDDYFFSLEDIQSEFKFFEENGLPSQKLLKYSAALGYTPKAFLNEQMRLFGFNKNAAEDFKIEVTNQIGDTKNGFKYLVKNGGFTTEGSAYLAAGIERWSGWNFQEEDTGELFCTPWMDHPLRIQALEKRFGKKINQITAKQQLAFMIQELKKDYPEQYRILTDPTSSKDDIKTASAIYFKHLPSDIDKTVESLLAR